MRPRNVLVILAGVAALQIACGIATAQSVPWPRCSDRLDGQVLCGQGSECECGYDSGGTLTGRIAGWRWSCDILRMCSEPAPAGADPQPVPPGFSYQPSGAGSEQPPAEPRPPGLILGRGLRPAPR